MKKYFRQWNVEEQRKQHCYDQHRPESFEDISTHGKEDECYQSRTDLTVSDCWPASLFCVVDRSSDTLSFLDLFTKSFIYQDISIYSHSDGKNNNCYSTER